MKVDQVLHMNGGEGEHSYASHSICQRTGISEAKPMLDEAIEDLYCRLFPETKYCLKIADLGCSVGPNTFLVVSEILDKTQSICQRLNRPLPCFQVFLNDLPGNDFNTVFKSLPGFYKKVEEEKGMEIGQCFIAAMPGSFYGRLFPPSSIHLFHSSYSVMWLSEVPVGLGEGQDLNKGNICIAKTSPPAVHEAYFEQFQKDFTTFLKCRAQELVHASTMVFTILGCINTHDPLLPYEFIGLKLHDMVLEGLIEEEKLDRFNLPLYATNAEEVKKLIEEEGSFRLNKLETFNMYWDGQTNEANSSLDSKRRAAVIAASLRSVIEPLLVAQFGDKIVDNLFDRFKEGVVDHMVTYNGQYVSLVISVTKKG